VNDLEDIPEDIHNGRELSPVCDKAKTDRLEGAESRMDMHSKGFYRLSQVSRLP